MRERCTNLLGASNTFNIEQEVMIVRMGLSIILPFFYLFFFFVVLVGM